MKIYNTYVHITAFFLPMQKVLPKKSLLVAHSNLLSSQQISREAGEAEKFANW